MLLKNKSLKNILIFLIIFSVSITTVTTPLKVWADELESETETIMQTLTKIDIDTNVAVVDGNIEKYNIAALINAIGTAMAVCFGHRRMSVYGKEIYSTNIKNGLFAGLGVGTEALGPYFEDILESKTDDGEVYCDKKDAGQTIYGYFAAVYSKLVVNGVTDISELTQGSFEKATEEDMLRLICDGDKPGLLSDEKNDSECHADDIYTLHVYDGSDAYLVKLYNEIVQKFNELAGENILTSWENLTGVFTPHLWFLIYRMDLGKRCLGREQATFTAGEENWWPDVYPSYNVETNTGSHWYAKGCYRVPDQKNDKAKFYTLGDKTRKRNCGDVLWEMKVTEGDYIRRLNHSNLQSCGQAMQPILDEAIDEIKTSKENGEFDGLGDEEKKQVDEALDELKRISSQYEFLAFEDGTVFQFSKPGHYNYDELPDDNILQCRKDIPFIQVETKELNSLSVKLEEAKNHCKEQLDLGWVICPVIDHISQTLDNIIKAVGDFF